MFPPGATGSGASLFDRVSTGGEVTVVVAFGPVCGNDSLLAMGHPVLVIKVPLASGLFTRTTSCTDREEPEFRAPMFQVTTPAARVPPAVADTKVVLAGTVSVITTPVAFAVPVFEYDSV